MDSSFPGNCYTRITSNLIVLDLSSVDIWGSNCYPSFVPHIQLQVRSISPCPSAKFLKKFPGAAVPLR